MANAERVYVVRVCRAAYSGKRLGCFVRLSLFCDCVFLSFFITALSPRKMFKTLFCNHQMKS